MKMDKHRKRMDELLNLKHIHLTKRPKPHILKFAEILLERHQPIRVRYVLVPGLTDDAEDSSTSADSSIP